MSDSSAGDENTTRRLSEPWPKSLAALPRATYAAGELVLQEGTRTGRLLILKKGAVGVVKSGVEIAKVAEPGAVFGELSALLDAPHGADVRALEPSEFHVADAGVLMREPAALLYVATVLARRLDLANRGLIELKSELQAGAPPSLISATLDKIEALLSAIGTGYIRAGAGMSGYPFQ
ncbi:MAG: cyclic nucleotide-binding domain-containing protein [Xanthobacteraceae bacterium]